MERTVSTSIFPSAPDRLIRLPELKRLLGNPSTASVYRWMQRGLFPRPQRIGMRGVGWRLSEIIAIVEAGFKPTGGDDHD